MTVAELKPHLKDRNLPVSGSKAILVQRLEEYKAIDTTVSTASTSSRKADETDKEKVVGQASAKKKRKKAKMREPSALELQLRAKAEKDRAAPKVPKKVNTALEALLGIF